MLGAPFPGQGVILTGRHGIPQAVLPIPVPGSTQGDRVFVAMSGSRDMNPRFIVLGAREAAPTPCPGEGCCPVIRAIVRAPPCWHGCDGQPSLD